MEAFGRMIAVSLGAIGLVSFLVFYHTASVRWQKEESVRSLSHAYAERILSDKVVSCADLEAFRNALNRLGEYRMELVVYERRRFEGSAGRVYLFTEWSPKAEDRVLSEGSYVRIVVTEKAGGKSETFFFGGGSLIVVGGRIA